MARVLVLFVLCVLPALVNARLLGNPFVIQGYVYCDTCRCGFETTATTRVAGARVRLECRERSTLLLRYTSEAVTDSEGNYSIKVEDDHQDQICRSVLVSSPLANCNEPDPGRSSANVIVTRYNGVINDVHPANAMGFFKSRPLGECPKLLKKYLEFDDN